jgi:hypothetical protein
VLLLVGLGNLNGPLTPIIMIGLISSKFGFLGLLIRTSKTNPIILPLLPPGSFFAFSFEFNL